MKKINKLLSVILCLAMVLSFAVAVSAEGTDGALTSMDELVSGEYYIVCSNGVGLGNVDGTWILSGTDVAWTVTVTDNGVTLQDGNGTFVAPKGGDKNGISTKEYEWTVSCTDGLFTFAGQGTDTVYLAYNGDAAYLKFRGYKTSTCNGDPDTYPCGFYLIPVGGSEEEVVLPAGPVACEIPGTLEYTFENDDAASAGVMFRWTATADGELCVARMGENYMTNVQINGDYGEIGNEGYVVKTGDVVDIIVYGYGAGAISVPVEYITGNEGEAAVGTESNPEIITANTEYVKALESGEYFYQYTATAAGEITITTTGDGTHNMEVIVNGDTCKIYSNWDNNGEFITLTANAGDVLSIKVYFDFPGAGTITFTVAAEAGEVTPEPSVPTIEDGRYVISWGALTFAALGEDKTYGYNPAGDKNNLTETDYITITNVNGGFTMQDCYGRYMFMKGTYNSVNVSTEMPTEGHIWTLVEGENGLMIMNVEKEKYLAYSEQYTSWGVYATISETSVLTITAVVEDEPIVDGYTVYLQICEDFTDMWPMSYNQISVLYSGEGTCTITADIATLFGESLDAPAHLYLEIVDGWADLKDYTLSDLVIIVDGQEIPVDMSKVYTYESVTTTDWVNFVGTGRYCIEINNVLGYAASQGCCIDINNFSASESLTISFTLTAPVEEPVNPGTGDGIMAILSILCVSGMGLTAVSFWKKN